MSFPCPGAPMTSLRWSWAFCARTWSLAVADPVCLLLIGSPVRVLEPSLFPWCLFSLMGRPGVGAGVPVS
eukprot:12498606-Heterocapsa_arctica.AAC.1